MDVEDAVRLQGARELCHNGKGRELRIAAGLSLADVAAVCEVDQSTVLRWERGERMPQRRAALAYGTLMDRLAQESA